MSINRILDQDVRQIRRSLDGIIVETENQYKKTYQALNEEDYDLAEEVILGYDQILAMQDNFINMALWKIAKQGMVASDLRLAIGSILIVREILKIAEYSKTIARYLVVFQPDKKATEQLKNSFQKLTEMLDLIKTLIDHYEKDLTARVVKLEKEINQDFLTSKQKMISSIRNAKSDESAMLLYSSLRQIKNLEKAGDRIVNIQEILNFIRTGTFEDVENIQDNTLI